MRVVARVELRQRHGERHLHVLDAPDLARVDARHEPREGRMVDVVVVHADHEAERGGFRGEQPRVLRRQRQRFLGEDRDAHVEQLQDESDVRLGRRQEMRDVDVERRQLVDGTQRAVDAETAALRIGARAIGIDERHRRALRDPPEAVEVVIRDVTRADDCDARRLAGAARAPRSRHRGHYSRRVRAIGVREDSGGS